MVPHIFVLPPQQSQLETEMASDRLLLDTMLGKLATYLRMCGYDTAYALDEGVEADDDLRRTARTQDRRLVTRDTQLAARVDDAILLAEREVGDQLGELAEKEFDLTLPAEPARCGICNAPLVEVGDDEATPEYAPDPPSTRVWRCTECGQHFWKGSHWEDVAATLADVQ